MSANNPSVLQTQILKTLKNRPDLCTKNLVKNEILQKFPELLDCDNQKKTQRIKRSFEALEKRKYINKKDADSEEYLLTNFGFEFIENREERLNPTKERPYVLEKRKTRLLSKKNKIKKNLNFIQNNQIAL